MEPQPDTADATTVVPIGDGAASLSGYHRLRTKWRGSWRDLIATANMVRSMLGVSPSAWEEARTVLGPRSGGRRRGILQRGTTIRQPAATCAA